ncbi:MAG TPA: tetratricopeptide repeat protein [Stellaceae bacterium]|nr:tetratricopeptide repeat protein [Stellaceae bacterium]
MAAIAALSVVEPSLAGTLGPWRECADGAGISRDLQIAACTAVINSRHAAKAQLPSAYYNRGHAYAEKSQPIRALADFERAIRLKPNYPEALLGRGEILAQKNRWRHAVWDYDRAIRLKPDFADAYEDRAIAFDTLHEFDRAIADYDRALRLKPNDASLAFLREGAKLAKGDGSGRDDIARAKELNPDPPIGVPTR